MRLPDICDIWVVGGSRGKPRKSECTTPLPVLYAICVYLSLCFSPCVCAFLCVHYHLHWVCEHHTVEANEVLVVQGVHGVDLTDEILQSFGLA